VISLLCVMFRFKHNLLFFIDTVLFLVNLKGQIYINIDAIIIVVSSKSTHSAFKFFQEYLLTCTLSTVSICAFTYCAITAALCRHRVLS